MGRLLRQRTVSLLALLAACAVVPGAIIHFFGETQVEIPSGFHFFALGISAGLAAAAAVVLTVSGARRGDARSVLIGTAFSSMAALLCIHGLMTPGFLVGMNGLVAFAGAATLPVGGSVLALAVIPELRRPGAVQAGARPPGRAARAHRRARRGRPGGSAARAGRARAAQHGRLDRAGRWASSCTCALGARAARTYLLTRRFADLTVVFGLVLLAVSLFPALLMEYYELGWWIGHGWELIGIGLVGVPVALDLHRGAQSRPLTKDLRASELVSAADAFMGPTVRALLVRLSVKDDYTAEHTRGVALRAVQVGEELGARAGRGCASWRSAGCSTTWASWRCRTRSFRSRARSRTRSST